MQKDVVRGWRRIPRSWKRFVVLALAGWAVQAAFGSEGVIILLVCLFLVGFAVATWRPRPGTRVRGFAVGELAGQAADFVAVPLLAPIALAWWDVAKSGDLGGLGRAIGYTAVFVIGRVAIPPMVTAILQPEPRDELTRRRSPRAASARARRGPPRRRRGPQR